jgi:hypothetical protein
MKGGVQAAPLKSRRRQVSELRAARNHRFGEARTKSIWLEFFHRSAAPWNKSKFHHRPLAETPEK